MTRKKTTKKAADAPQLKPDPIKPADNWATPPRPKYETPNEELEERGPDPASSAGPEGSVPSGGKWGNTGQGGRR